MGACRWAPFSKKVQAMTEKGKTIHAYWCALTAIFVVIGKMTRKKAEKEAYKMIVDRYGEETLVKEFALK